MRLLIGLYFFFKVVGVYGVVMYLYIFNGFVKLSIDFVFFFQICVCEQILIVILIIFEMNF